MSENTRKSLTKPQFEALVKFSRAAFPSPNSCGVRRSVAWRLADLGFLTKTGTWGLTQAGLDAIAKFTEAKP